MDKQLRTELEARTADRMEAVEHMVSRVDDDAHPWLKNLRDSPRYQRRLARGLAQTDLLLKIGHERGVLDPWDMQLPDEVVRALIHGEGDRFSAALEAMDRLQPATLSTVQEV